MRKTILILPLFLLVSNLYSQQDALLKKFKFRNVNYRAVTFGIGGHGQYVNTDYVNGEGTAHGGGGGLGMSYGILKSTDKILLNASASFSTSFGSNKNKNVLGENKHRRSYFAPGLSVLNKWFSKGFFMELGADANANLSSFKDIYTSPLTSPSNTTKNRQDNYWLSGTAGLGKGRLENVTSMQNALWLHEVLKREARLKHSLSDVELNGLGDAIVQANNTRVLDSRRRTQFVLETVDNFLQKNDLINTTDVRYFSNLNDILFFAINLPRLSGTETYIRFTPAIAYLINDQSQFSQLTKNSARSTSKSARLSAGISRYKPVNLHHQNNYGISVFANYRENDATQKYFASGVLINELRTNPVLRQAGASLFFEHAIYPNTRTQINFNLQSEGGYQKFDGESSTYASVNLFGVLDYFISYRTRFTCTLGASYQCKIYGFDYYYYYLQLLPDNIQFHGNAGFQISL